jgi:uncharacterized damage-inducible protein DinB
MHLNDIRILFEFNYWAKERMLSIVKTVPTDIYLKDLGSSHGGIHGTLVHMAGAEEVWMKRWKNERTTGLPKPEEFPSFESLANHWNLIETAVSEFCNKLYTDEDIYKSFSYSDLKGNTFTQPLYQSMQHLVNHSTYHRGQVVTMLRQTGISPVGTDLITFYRQKK